jgi:hypothetical protein
MKLAGLQLLKDLRKVAEGGYGEGQILDSLLQSEISVDTLPLPLKKTNFSKATRRQIKLFFVPFKGNI